MATVVAGKTEGKEEEELGHRSSDRRAQADVIPAKKKRKRECTGVLRATADTGVWLAM